VLKGTYFAKSIWESQGDDNRRDFADSREREIVTMGTMRCIFIYSYMIERRLNKINPIGVIEWIVKYIHENVLALKVLIKIMWISNVNKWLKELQLWSHKRIELCNTRDKGMKIYGFLSIKETYYSIFCNIHLFDAGLKEIVGHRRSLSFFGWRGWIYIIG